MRRVGDRHALLLESNLYAAPQHPALGVEADAAFIASYAGLEVENISCIYDRLGANGQSESWEALGD